jgi:hypothetical protein
MLAIYDQFGRQQVAVGNTPAVRLSGVQAVDNITHVVENLTILASAARTTVAEGTSAWFTNLAAAQGIIMVLDVTTPASGFTLTPSLEVEDPVSGKTPALWTSSVPITASGSRVYGLFPGVPATMGTDRFGLALPRRWRVKITPTDATSVTYSVGASTVRVGV